jgi:hypothetical protein
LSRSSIYSQSRGEGVDGASGNGHPVSLTGEQSRQSTRAWGGRLGKLRLLHVGAKPRRAVDLPTFARNARLYAPVRRRRFIPERTAGRVWSSIMAFGFKAWMSSAAIVAGASLCLVGPAFAAGGAHVVEDSEVEDPGHCHYDSWVSRSNSHDGGFTFSPACTFEAMPKLELSAAIQRNWGSGSDTLAGPGFKYNFLPESDGVGLALTGGGVWSTRDGHLDNAALVVPLTLPLNEQLRVHFNAGWNYTHGRGREDQLFLGAQAEYSITKEVSLMAEVFNRDGDPMGSQAGVRWMPGGGDVTIDLLYGRRLDGVTPRTVTLGLTLRY